MIFKKLRRKKSSLPFPTHSREAMDECGVECADSLDHQTAQSPTVEEYTLRIQSYFHCHLFGMDFMML